MFVHTHARTCAAILLTLSAAAASPLSAQQPPVLARFDNLSPHETKVDVFTLSSPQTVMIEASGADEFFPAHGAWSFLDRIFGSLRDDDARGAWRGNAWIVDADTRRVVWELRTSDADEAKGGLRGFKGAVRLEPGMYEAYYASYSAFRTRNSVYDDDGVSKKFSFTVRGQGEALPSAVYLQSVDAFRRDAIISLTGLKRNETRRTGFALSEPTRIEVYALGEVSGSSATDYGWIVNVDTYEKVWKLTRENSQHAGGAEKNRMARQALTLPPGRYAAIYTLDDSHDIQDWNSPPPVDPGFWGLTIRLVNQADRDNVKLFRYDGKPMNAVATLLGIGDRENRTTGFTITKPMAVRVHSLGEGTRSRMSDYGWITDAKTHRRVWEMTYAASGHAGGSYKNRVASEVIQLQPGSYVVHYRTDDSHAFGDWNAGPPVDAALWGISVSPVNAGDVKAVSAYDAATEGGRVIAKLIGMGDREAARATFRLDEPADVRIYAIGEGSGNNMSDYGFIEERGTDRVVWEMTYRMTEHAGGADKNRVFDGIVRLPAGQYVLHWQSDDSHSFENWNMDEPGDQSHWGITVYKPDN